MKRFKKILKWTGVILGALAAIGLIANAWFVWTTDARLERQLAAIREAGDPLTLADLAQQPIPPEKNAATYLRRAKPDVLAIENEIGQWIEAEKQQDLWQYFSEKQPMPERMHKAVKAIYAAHPKVVGLLQQAVDCPDYDAQLNYALSPSQFMEQILPIVQEFRSYERVLRYRTPSLVLDGNCDEAASMALAIFRLARHAEHTPMLTGYLVAVTIQNIAVNCANNALQAGPVSQETRRALDAELAVQERMEGYARAIKSDRAFGLDSFRDFPLRGFWLYSRGYWNQYESEYLDMMEAFVGLAGDPRPYRETEKAIHKVQSSTMPPKSTFAQQIFPALQATHHAVARTRAMIRCLRVLIALKTHVPASSNVAPKLTELGLPAETTADPFTGDPLHVKKLPRGWLVYSVGPNFQDDGGKLDNPVTGDVGIGPPPAAKPAEPAKK
jgi:hypothetical protein